MIPNKIKDIILSKRIKRKNIFNDIHTVVLFQDIIDIWEIPNIDILICNTLQRRTSFTLCDKISIIVFDNYLLEIMHIFKSASENSNAVWIEYLFYKLLCESYYLHGYMELAKIDKRLLEKKFDEAELNFFREPHIPNHDTLTIWQVFLLAHEVMHCYFQKDPKSLDDQLEILNKFFRKMNDTAENVSKMEKEKLRQLCKNSALAINDLLIGEIVDSAKHPIKVNSNYMEEICCDNLAATLTLYVAIEKYDIDAEKCAVSLFNALSTQFLIFCTDKFVEDNFSSLAINDFTNRLLILRFAITNYFSIRQSKFAESIQTSLRKEYENWNNGIYHEYIKFLLLQKSIRHHYEDGININDLIRL